jgi:glycosyltransferase involved in cell wall biosynthesis
MRVCFAGAYDPAYPRNLVIRSGLAAAGVEVVEARVRERRAFFRYPALARRLLERGSRADVVWIPEFRHKDVVVAKLVSGDRRLVFDPLVSRVDTLVEDWGLHEPGSLQAKWNGWIDRVSMTAPDLVICDTWAHGRLFETLGVRRERLRRVLVGAEQRFFEVGPPAPSAAVRILYLGGFLPLHGTLHIVEAAAALERRADLPPYVITLAGGGIEYDTAIRRARELGLTRVRFPGRSDYAAAPALLEASDIVLGAFGAGEKAGRVVPHKVYQGLAAGRAVLSGDGEGVREVFEPGVHLDVVPRGNPEALAEGLARLIADPARRLDLRRAARTRSLEIATPMKIGAALAATLEELK